jgi:hypothetical protein
MTPDRSRGRLAHSLDFSHAWARAPIDRNRRLGPGFLLSWLLRVAQFGRYNYTPPIEGEGFRYTSDGGDGLGADIRAEASVDRSA